MRSNDKNETVARIAARGIMLTALLVMMSAGAGTNPAQAGAVKSSTAAAPAAQAPAKGAHEAIGVHGHWTIEVKNPDGTLAKHVEFENGLCIGTGAPGEQSRLLTGGGAVGGWEIKLGNSSIPAEPQDPRVAEYWIPWCGFRDGLQFVLDQNNDHRKYQRQLCGAHI